LEQPFIAKKYQNSNFPLPLAWIFHMVLFLAQMSEKGLDPLFILLVLLITFTWWFLLEEQNSNYQKIRWALLWKHQLEAFVMILWSPNSLTGFLGFQ
jgi:hypothetical protein